jgi:precorrin-8X/cobalt-precorrin-8 methylmutase
MPLFDAYIFVDWSAAAKPGPVDPAADQIWVGTYTPAINIAVLTTYHRTRENAFAQVRDALLDHANNQRRVLVGFDFPYGYPYGLSQAMALPAEMAA